MKIRIIITVLALLVYMSVQSLWRTVDSPVIGAANAQQMTDTMSGYVVSKIGSSNPIRTGACYLSIIILAATWGSACFKLLKRRVDPATILLLLVMIALSGCLKPVKVLDPVDIGPNETAWAIPLDGMSQAGQVKFNSVDFLNQKKVSAKRYMVDKVERQIGRFGYEIEWIPATKIIKVDRSLVTREWTDDKGTGAKKDGIGVVTRDSVQVRVGLTITASIEEDDASTYLYYHGEKPLKDVIDQNIRSFAVAELTKEYSQLGLSDAQQRSTEIYSNLFVDSKATFKQKGISVQYLGNAEGLEYSDPKVQESINQRYLAEQQKSTAKQEQETARIKNETAILTAEATATAAQKTFVVREASELQTELRIRLMEAEAKLAMAQKWDGKLPENILPSDSPLLMSLGTKSAPKAK